ncbi:hypothetical protein HPP92_011906 [Vanilla planifolia]|uniref:Phthiocerol/phthiodiolone dimycocerosyl transferase C-terminal domain-containing protein n=1 Tax=Vanilla planifolia TaxID=51239 RepID=A0A835QZZ3_VANPL|nr:hypothetical protein HPP92_011906 [Vanilla planifolia]
MDKISCATSGGSLGGRTSSRSAGGTELSWCRAVPGGTGITVLALLLSRSFPFPHLRDSLRRIQFSYPILRARLPSAAAASSGVFSPPILVSSSPSDEIELIPDDRLPAPAVIGDSSPVSLFHSILESEMNRNPWAETADGEALGSLFPTIYDLPEPDWSVLALRFHTGVCDRTTGVAILKELMDLMGRAGERDDEGEDGVGDLILPIEDLIRKDDSWKPFWARAKDLIGYSLNGLRSNGLPFEDAGSPRHSEVVRLVVDAEETQQLLGACHTKGVKLCSALTAAGFLAAYASKKLNNNQAETYSVITLVDCRKFLNPPLNDKHIGFYHSAILNTHTVRGGDRFWELAARCHSAYSNAKNNNKHLKDIDELNFLMCKAIENPHLTPASSLRTALICVFEEMVNYDVPMEQLQEFGIEDYVGCSSVHGVGSSVAVFDTIRNGQIDCACVYPSPLHSRKQMMEFVESMKRILLEGSHAVDLTS